MTTTTTTATTTTAGTTTLTDTGAATATGTGAVRVTLRVVVCESDADVSNLVVHKLLSAGAEVTVCPLPGTALAAVTGGRPDVLVLGSAPRDPAVGDLARQVRTRAAGGSDPGSRTQVLLLGDETAPLPADDRLPRPFSPRELLARVQALAATAERAGADGESGRHRDQGPDRQDPRVTVPSGSSRTPVAAAAAARGTFQLREPLRRVRRARADEGALRPAASDR